jgi:hypothetical protein
MVPLSSSLQHMTWYSLLLAALNSQVWHRLPVENSNLAVSGTVCGLVVGMEVHLLLLYSCICLARPAFKFPLTERYEFGM